MPVAITADLNDFPHGRPTRKLARGGYDLTLRQKLACALRILARDEWSQNLAGHITCVDNDGENLLVNPWGLWWDEVTASTITRVSPSGRVLDGEWDVTPAIFIHSELHRTRPDARVVVHNHPFYATVLAGLGELPRVTEQTGCMFDSSLKLYREYTGGVMSPELGQQLADGIGDATAAILVNHGALVVGESIEQATYRAISLERVCKLWYHTVLAGRAPVEIDADIRAAMTFPMADPDVLAAYWGGAVRQLLRAEGDDVLG